MKVRSLIIFLALALPSLISAKLPKLKKAEPVVELYDTIRPAQLRFSGYEKPNAALRETFLVTNLDSIDICGFAFEFEYFDMEGRQLHKAAHQLTVDIPAGETRMVSVPTWDRNHSFHYFRSPAPQRRPSSPYKVKSIPIYSLSFK